MPFRAVQFLEDEKTISEEYFPEDVKKQWIEEGQTFHCPHCLSEFILVAGSETIRHFRHKVECPYHYEPETQEHLQMKKWVYENIPKHNNIKFKQYEYKIEKNIADVYFELNTGIKIVIECQCTPISPKEMEERTNKYSKNNVYVLWLLGKTNTCMNGYLFLKWNTPEDQLKQIEVSTKAFERWVHDNYFMRVYYFIRSSTGNYIHPIHLHYTRFKVLLRRIIPGTKVTNYKLYPFENNSFKLAKFNDKKWWKNRGDN